MARGHSAQFFLTELEWQHSHNSPSPSNGAAATHRARVLPVRFESRAWLWPCCACVGLPHYPGDTQTPAAQLQCRPGQLSCTCNANPLDHRKLYRHSACKLHPNSNSFTSFEHGFFLRLLLQLHLHISKRYIDGRQIITHLAIPHS